jgi:sterol desaturase/sphingolipid hydroxylase (fatty acid hydroxylase superfamily)
MSGSSSRSISLFTRHARGRSHDLGKMDLRALVGAFFSYPTVLIYLALAAGSLWEAVRLGALRMPLQAALTVAATFLAYGLIWYVLHRWVLHSPLLYRSPLTARLWKRIHFDHHQDPHRMEVLFGHPLTTIPTIVAVTLPLGWVIGGPAGAGFALFSGFVFTLVYEFCHCCMHLNYAPRQAWLRRAKTLHMAHHFHDETGNYGIISFWPDLLFGTIYEQPSARPRSPTVFNLGYDDAAAARFPWVAELSPAPCADEADAL